MTELNTYTAVAPSVIGLTIEQARGRLTAAGFSSRLVFVNGGGLMCHDNKPDNKRINLEVEDAIVEPTGDYTVRYLGGKITRQYPD